MEILIEILVWIVWFLSDGVVQAILEIIFEIGIRSLPGSYRRSEPINPVLAGIGYLILGAGAGGLSLLIPKMFTIPEWLRIVNLIVTPIACGFIMVKIGQFRARRGDRPIRIDTFIFGYLFALALALVRFIWR